jgi:molybdate transport system substrate-binding protein
MKLKQAKGVTPMRLAYKNLPIALIIASFSLFLFSSCSQDQGGRSRIPSSTVLVKADTSLRPTLLEMAENYSYVTFHKIQFHFVPDGDMFNSPEDDSFDVYIFGNNSTMDDARELNVVDTTGEITLAYAIPCIIVPKFNPHMITNLSDLVDHEIRIGIADPESDVLGGFALEIFQESNIYEKVNHRLIQVGPSALDLANHVSRSKLDAAISWTMSISWNPESFEVVLLVPSEIPRVAAITAIRSSNPTNAENANRLMTYLNSDRCKDIFRKWGYQTTDADVDMYAPAASIGGRPEF